MQAAHELTQSWNLPGLASQWLPLHGEERDDTVPKRPSILVVDDEPGIVEFLRYVLEDSGYEVRTAANGEEALAAIRQTAPDLLLTDLMMPELNGWGLCDRLRGDRRLERLPIVGMSAVEPGHARWDAFLRKPFEIDDLLAVIASFVPAPSIAERR